MAWELASPGDVGGEQVGRQMTTLCHWAMTGGYCGPDCGYTGPYFDIDGNPTDDPARDECDGCLGTGCIPRFGEGNQLPFGGFPAVSIIARADHAQAHPVCRAEARCGRVSARVLRTDHPFWPEPAIRSLRKHRCRRRRGVPHRTGGVCRGRGSGRDRRRGAQPPRCHQPTECRRCRDVQRLGPDMAHPELAGGRPAYHRARRPRAAARTRVRAWGAGLLAGLLDWYQREGIELRTSSVPMAGGSGQTVQVSTSSGSKGPASSGLTRRSAAT